MASPQCLDIERCTNSEIPDPNNYATLQPRVINEKEHESNQSCLLRVDKDGETTNEPLQEPSRQLSYNVSVVFRRRNIEIYMASGWNIIHIMSGKVWRYGPH